MKAENGPAARRSTASVKAPGPLPGSTVKLSLSESDRARADPLRGGIVILTYKGKSGFERTACPLHSHAEQGRKIDAAWSIVWAPANGLMDRCVQVGVVDGSGDEE